MIKAIRSKSADNYIGYLCNIRTAPLVLSNPNVSKVFVFEKDEYRNLWKVSKVKCISQLFSLLKEIRNEKFNIAFDLSMAQEFGLFLKLAGIEERIGYNYRGRGIFLTKRIDLKQGYSDRHMVDYYIELLKAAGVESPGQLKPKIYITEKEIKNAQRLLSSRGVTDKESFVCIAAGAGASWGQTSFRKHWPREKFAELARMIHDNLGLKVVLLGSDGERPICDYIKEKEKRCIDLCGQTDLLTFAAIISNAKALITNDGGPLHVAVAVGTKTVSIFGPVDEKVYGPYPAGRENIVVKNDSIECRPCYKSFRMPECGNRKCLEDITPGVVIEAVKKTLNI
jgi:lipopolysaccharide heptosyltransferase II